MRKPAPGPWFVGEEHESKADILCERGRVATAVNTRPMEFDAGANARLIAAAPDMLAALRVAIDHIEHMAAWIGKQNAGYSFESLGEDMPGMRAALAKAQTPEREIG